VTTGRRVNQLSHQDCQPSRAPVCLYVCPPVCHLKRSRRAFFLQSSGYEGSDWKCAAHIPSPARAALTASAARSRCVLRFICVCLTSRQARLTSRQIKCDEVYPRCFNCRRHETPCSLSESSPPDPPESSPKPRVPATPRSEGAEATGRSLSSSGAATRAATRAATSPSPGPGPGPSAGLGSSSLTISDTLSPLSPDELRAADLELMHHYCTATADTLSSKPEICQVWRLYIPREGYRHPYVMRGILSVAAAHKAHLLPYSRRRYLALADYHQTVGSEGFREALQAAASPERALSLWVFGCLVVIHSMTLPLRSGGALDDAIGRFIELTTLFRGLMTTMSPLVERLLRSELAPMVYGIYPFGDKDILERFLPPENIFLPPDTWDALQAVRDFFRSDLPAADQPAYLETVGHLETVAKLIALNGVHVDLGAVLAWITRVPVGVLAEMGAGRPHALLLLAYYSVLWESLDSKAWFGRAWPPLLLEAVEARLTGDERFEELLRWPRQSLLHMRT
jgi:hypothetical protein